MKHRQFVTISSVSSYILYCCLQFHCNIVFILICSFLSSNISDLLTGHLLSQSRARNLRNNSISVSILSVVPSSTAGMTKSPILPSEGSLRGGRQNEQPLQHHMGVKYGCCIKRGQRVRQYVIHTDNKLSVCGHDEMREREKGTVMAF